MVSKVSQFQESTFSFRLNARGGGGSGANVQMRNQATVTEQLFSQEAGTSTRVEMVDAAVSCIFY